MTEVVVRDGCNSPYLPNVGIWIDFHQITDSNINISCNINKHFKDRMKPPDRFHFWTDDEV